MNGSGTNWLIGGVAAAVMVPLLAIAGGMPFWLACLIGAAAGGGIGVLMTPRSAFPQLDASGVARGKIAFVRELLTDAAPLSPRLDAAAKAIRAPQIAARVRHLASLARGIFVALEKDPLRVERVRRFLTYYLPRAAEIAEAYAALEQSALPDAARLASTGELIDRLDAAFTRYAANLRDADLDKLDIELKLLKSSLDEDLGPAIAPARTTAEITANQGKGRA
ncbi:5-bromo-4-chloroindolyl phosphate hydrolysis family protein [Bradyrhizobium sp.]|uniref:5-bromo-4-chloroindolyl phosphate hydrolysis family protein n=1 Tax=Bradyrhizobium sp. TaxID=376 RepID=UPI0025C3ACA2|nr:5-bromo-4-chloroindolyl phosphate hydrolysis family protein [Bradyrhizobium sp.]